MPPERDSRKEYWFASVDWIIHKIGKLLPRERIAVKRDFCNKIGPLVTSVFTRFLGMNGRRDWRHDLIAALAINRLCCSGSLISKCLIASWIAAA